MFLLWEDFKARLVQMYGDLEEEETAIRKLYKLRQTASAIVYTTEF